MPYGAGPRGIPSQFVPRNPPYTSPYEQTAVHTAYREDVRPSQLAAAYESDNFVRYPYEVTHGPSSSYSEHQTWSSFGQQHHSDIPYAERHSSSLDMLRLEADRGFKRSTPNFADSVSSNRSYDSDYNVGGKYSADLRKNVEPHDVGYHSYGDAKSFPGHGSADYDCDTHASTIYRKTTYERQPSSFPEDSYREPLYGNNDSLSHRLPRDSLLPSSHNDVHKSDYASAESRYVRSSTTANSMARSARYPTERTVNKLGFEDTPTGNQPVSEDPTIMWRSSTNFGDHMPARDRGYFQPSTGVQARWKQPPGSARLTNVPAHLKGMQSTSRNGQQRPKKANKANASATASKVPLYCEVCKVSLNAEAQAQQHYGGKAHARKLRMLDCPDSHQQPRKGLLSDPVVKPILPGPAKSRSLPEERTGLSQGGKTGNSSGGPRNGSSHGAAKKRAASSMDGSRPAVNNPSLYCNLCSVSFNSSSQADFHYRGKKHKARVAEPLTKRQKVKPSDTGVAPHTGARTSDALSRENMEDIAAEQSDSVRPCGDAEAETTKQLQEQDAISPIAQLGTAEVPAEATPADAEPSFAGISEPMTEAGTVADGAKDAPKRPNAAIRYSCDICPDLHFHRPGELIRHLHGAKHTSRMRELQGQMPGASEKPTAAPRASTALRRPASCAAYVAMPNLHGDNCLQRLPSGSYYCERCNATCDSELSFNVHLDSVRHKQAFANRNLSDTAYNS